jgi:diguanylate cyclase (GGDEF)-like protein
LRLPARDLIGRVGGDGFLIVQELPVESAVPSLRRIERAIRDYDVGVPGGHVKASVSVGVAPWPSGLPLDDALAVADRGLYAAKSVGGATLRIGDATA